jgi:NAD(P)-dependent dehydrogenase (short-subunit alcohol dehydrogenase family)
MIVYSVICDSDGCFTRGVVGTIPAYAATKGAVDTVVMHFASLLGANGIRVNAVAPGVVDTEMSNFTKTAAARTLRSACRRSNVSRSLKTLQALSPSSLPKTRDGLPALPFTWTAAEALTARKSYDEDHITTEAGD